MVEIDRLAVHLDRLAVALRLPERLGQRHKYTGRARLDPRRAVAGDERLVDPPFQAENHAERDLRLRRARIEGGGPAGLLERGREFVVGGERQPQGGVRGGAARREPHGGAPLVDGRRDPPGRGVDPERVEVGRDARDARVRGGEVGVDVERLVE